MLWLASASAWAQSVTIGSTTVPVVTPATSSPYFGPLYRFSATSTTVNSRHAYLYSAAELGLPIGATITQLDWLKSDAGGATGNNVFNVWLGNTSNATLTTGTAWSALTAQATQVYAATAQQVSGAAGAYFGVAPTTSFVYTGGNLLILTDWALSSTTNAPNAIEFVTNPATGQAIGTASGSALTNTTTLSTTTYGNRRPTLRVTYTPPPACTAPPTAGTVLASSTSVCANSPVSFTLQGASFGTGLTYQWQSSANGTTYTNISGATNPNYSASSLTASTYFRAVLSCSGQSATTPAVQVTVSNPTYATLPFATSFESAWIDGCATRDIPSNNWRNTPSTGNNSWRRDDDATAAGWTNPTSYGYTPAASQGSRSARFHSGYSTAGQIGTMDLYVNLSAAGTKVLTFDYINTSGTDSLSVQVSTDGGATFGPALFRQGISAAWTPKSVSFTATSATAVIRFRARADFGSTDIGLDNVSLDVLSGVPNCASNLSPANNATGVLRPVTLTWSSGGGVATGYDVYFGTTSTPPLVSSNQAATSYTPAGTLLPGTVYYYQIVPRNANGAATGCAVSQFTTSTTFQYCSANLGSYCGTADITTVTVPTTTLNNAGTTCSVSNGSGYTAYPASGSTTATLLPGATYQLSVTTSAAAIVSVWVDYNQNGTYEASEWTQVSTATTANQATTVSITVPGSAASGQTGLRVRSRSTGSPNGATDACTEFFSGETEDYIVTIAPGAPCTAPPTAGTVTASATSICVPTAVTLGLQGASFGSGLTYQWQSSTNGTTYTDISGATRSSYVTAPVTATTYFRAVLSCSGQSATSTPIQVTLNAPAYAALPVLENFDNTWVSVCATREVPSNNWRMTADPADVDASWRRSDDGASAGWTSPTGGAYSPLASQGLHSARFHSYYADDNKVGTLDLYANLSATGNKRLTFDFINPSGDDSLTVHVSTDGGLTFGPALVRLNTATAWSSRVLQLTTTSATAVIRFRGVGDFGANDIGLDNVRVESANGCLSPAGLAVGTTTTTTAVLSWAAGGTGTYTVEYGPIGFQPGSGTSVPGITGTTTTLTGLTPGTPYQFYVTQNCGATTSAAGGPVVFNTQIVNDDPSGAVTLNVGTSCTPTNGTNVGATTTTVNGYANPGSGATGCGIAGTPKDVWFKFTTAATGPTSTAVRISVTGVPASQLRAFSAASAAGPFTQIGCSSTSSTAAAPNLDLSSLTPSTTYYVRVSGYGSSDPQGPFTICASLLPNCAAPVAPDASGVTSNSATLVWGGVQSTGSTYEIQYGAPGFTLGQGTTAGGVTGQTTTLAALTANTDYCFYVRQNCGTTNGFSAWVGPTCFRTNVAAATNDEPCTAIAATVGPNGYVTGMNGTTVGATTSTGGGLGGLLPACSPASGPKDVWFTVTLPAGQTSMSAVFNGNAAGMVRVFTAANCSTAFTQVGCQAATAANTSVGRVTFTGLTAGTLYYVAVSGYGSGDTPGGFTILSSRNQQLAGGQVDIFPNPVAGGSALNLRIKGAKLGTLRCEVLNILGQVVLTRSAEVRNSSFEQSLNTTGLAKGLYQVRLSIGNETMVQKVIVD
ncbi:hypothetical protein GCM10027048_13430 [Hymenobacter coalescens]